MVYDKFKVMLLSAINGEKPDSTNAYIAAYILEHPDEVCDSGIEDLAGMLHVGSGTISRFAKSVGLQSFAELKAVIRDRSRDRYFYSAGKTFAEGAGMLSGKIEAAVHRAVAAVKEQDLTDLCAAIYSSNSIHAYGLLKAEACAIELQVDLSDFGKRVRTAVSYADQMAGIRGCGSDELVIIFSYTGSYFDYEDWKAFAKKTDRPAIWMIYSGLGELPSFVDHALYFSSAHERDGHPFQMEAVERLIVMKYEEMYGENNL